MPTPMSHPVRILLAAVVAAVLTIPASPSGAANVAFEDGEFLQSDWEIVNQTVGSGGTGTISRMANGGNPDAFMKIRIELAPSGMTPPAVWSFLIKPGALYDPVAQGEIVAIDWEEDTRQVQAVGDGHRAAPALRQNGKLYVAPLDDDPRGIPNLDWAQVFARQLVAADFRTQASVNDHPDFSATASPIEFGSFRAQSGLVLHGGGQRTTGIDNWRIEVNAAPMLEVDDEIRAETHIEITPFSGGAVLSDDEEARPPLNLEDRVDAASDRRNARIDLASSAHASLAGGLGSRSGAVGPVNVSNPSIEGAYTTGRGSHLRVFVAQSNTEPTADINLTMFADGSLDIRSLVVNNPADPGPDQLFAEVGLSAVLHRIGGGRTTPYQRSARIVRNAGSLAVSTNPAGFASSFSFPNALGEPFAVLDYFEVLPAVATVPTNEEFGLELILETGARANAPAFGWVALADFANTMKFEITSATDGVVLQEVFAEPNATAEGTAYSGTAKFDVDKVGRSSRETSWSVTLHDDTWTAESEAGASLRGTLEAKGSSGRKFTLRPDPVALKELVGELEAHLEEETGKPTLVKLKGLKKAKARLKRSATGPSSKLVLKLDLSVKPKGKPKRRGTWKVTLEDPGVGDG